ncbi:MAG TPA: retropepsin-like aspartic protease [Steroidobacteraceae bacterium]|jgi:clan AA aspartic protease (TIGR02281 family)|nr:retropepsin-like aspartic protease [Steroidobacteraceae bacterium]
MVLTTIIGNPVPGMRRHNNVSGFPRAALLSILLLCGAAYPESIPLIHEHGTLQVPAVINGGNSLNFTIDSGATDVSIPANVFSTLIRSGTVSAQDFLDRRAYKLADGSTEMSQRFRIRSLRVGNLELRDVVASVVPSGGSLLLGQSFLSRLKSWSIDNERQALLITESATSQSPLIVPRAKIAKSGSDWVRLSVENDPAGELFVNTASFQGNGNWRWLWDKHVFPPHTEKWQGRWVNYAMDHWEFDCGGQRAKLNARTDYYEDGTRWVADSALISSAAWHRIQGDTWKDREMKLLCEWRPQEITPGKTPH